MLVMKYFFRGGVLLAFSALVSKFLGLWRDRLVVEYFSPQNADIIYAAFRIPDALYYLLVGGTIGLVVVPRLANLKNQLEENQYLSSCFWLVGFGFGLVSLIGVASAPWLVEGVFQGLLPTAKIVVTELSRWLFASVFLLSLSSVLAAFLQAKERFLMLALAPVVYMGSLGLGLFLGAETYQMTAVSTAAITGAALHLTLTAMAYFYHGGKLSWVWARPQSAWKNFGPDFARRAVNNLAFQVNQTVDLWIASFLLVGSVTAFTLGTTLGHVLLSIIGFSAANSLFPKLVKVKNNYPAQRQLLLKHLRLIAAITIPLSFGAAIWSEPLLTQIFGLEGTRLSLTQTVFWWTVISLPAACMLPVCSRLFLANEDTTTPLYATITGLGVATGLAVYLSLVYLPAEKAILGLALGNFTANTLGLVLFLSLIWWKYEKKC